jgi:hypothetical protein
MILKIHCIDYLEVSFPGDDKPFEVKYVNRKIVNNKTACFIFCGN